MKILSLRGWNYKTGLLVILFDNYPLINSSSELIIDKEVSAGNFKKAQRAFVVKMQSGGKILQNPHLLLQRKRIIDAEKRKGGKLMAKGMAD